MYRWITTICTSLNTQNAMPVECIGFCWHLQEYQNYLVGGNLRCTKKRYCLSATSLSFFRAFLANFHPLSNSYDEARQQNPIHSTGMAFVLLHPFTSFPHKKREHPKTLPHLRVLTITLSQLCQISSKKYIHTSSSQPRSL